MKPLTVSPLPSVRPDDDPGSWLMERGGFVDEEVVTAIMAKPLQIALAPVPRNQMLTSEDIDFAGWRKVPEPEFLAPNKLLIGEIDESNATLPLRDFSIVPPKSPMPENALEWFGPRTAKLSPAEAEPVIRRAAPPLMENEPEPLPMVSGNSRWWLACLAGVLTATAIALLLVHWIAGKDSPFKSRPPAQAPSVEGSQSELEMRNPAVPLGR